MLYLVPPTSITTSGSRYQRDMVPPPALSDQQTTTKQAITRVVTQGYFALAAKTLADTLAAADTTAQLNARLVADVSTFLHFHTERKTARKHFVDALQSFVASPNVAYAAAVLMVPRSGANDMFSTQHVIQLFKDANPTSHNRYTEQLGHAILLWSRQSDFAHVLKRTREEDLSNSDTELTLLEVLVRFGKSDLQGATGLLTSLEKTNPDLRTRAADFLDARRQKEHAELVRGGDFHGLLNEHQAAVSAHTVKQLSRTTEQNIQDPFGNV